MHDAVIVGASIAGASVAIHLARAGRDVLLLDRAAFPRRKVCGEGLFPAGVAALDALGVLDALDGAYQRLEGVRFVAGPHAATGRLGRGRYPAIGVRREVLDAALLDAAREVGATVRTGVTARGLMVRDRRVAAIETGDGPIEARAFVAADGLGSRLRRLAGLAGAGAAGRYGVSAHIRLPAPPDPLVEVTFRGSHECYLTPVGGHEANLAILAGRAAMHRFSGGIEGGFHAMLDRLPALRGGYELLDAPRAAGPFPVSCTRAWRANLVLAGDAAGFFDGISGEGMSLALVSAMDCAAAVDAYLDTGSYDPLRAYDRQRRAPARNSTLLARLTLLLGSHPAAARLAVRNLARRPETFAKLLAINSGESGLGALRPRDLLALAAGV